MNISRFFGATNREVMRQVRLAVGPDALIVSSKRVNGGVEILVADETPRLDADSLVPAASGRPELVDMIGDLKGSLEARMDELLWGAQLRRLPQAAVLFQRLLRAGFSTALLRAMLGRLPEGLGAQAAFQWARNELITHLPVLANEAAFWRPGLTLALVGPTGVGKTTTIAKLAARLVRRAGPDRLVLVTTDTYRIGAHEQLRIYGQMLHLPVHVAQDAAALAEILQSIPSTHTVLIDNVGVGQRDRYVARQAAMLGGVSRPVDRLLVLNAASQGDSLDEVARAYTTDGGPPLCGCLITKMDEASRLGAVLDVALRYRLAVHFVSDGQKVPEDLHDVQAADLVDRAMGTRQDTRTLYAPGPADLAALLVASEGTRTQDEAARWPRQQALLPRLLMHSVDGRAASLSELQRAVGLLEDDPVLAEAARLWRAHQSIGLPSSSRMLEQLSGVVREGLADHPDGLLIHDRRVLTTIVGRATWLGSAWFNGSGRPLAAGVQQGGFADGWRSPWAADPRAPNQQDALLAQMLQAETVAGDTLQVVAGATLALMGELVARDVRWLAHCSGQTRVQVADGVGVVSAVARRLVFAPLPSRAFACLESASGPVPCQLAWWVAQSEAQLPRRGQPPLPVSLFCLRAVDPRDGRITRTWHALGDRAAMRHGADGRHDGAVSDAAARLSDVSPDVLRRARALAMLSEYRGMQCLAATWLADVARLDDFVPRAILAAQLGLAAWQLARDPALAPAAAAAAGLLGAPRLSARQLPTGLLRLFALRDVLAVP